MALTDLPTLAAFLRISPTDSSQSTMLATLASAATSICNQFCRRATLETATFLDVQSGRDQPDLVLRLRPAYIVLATGTITNNSAVVTAISPTTSAMLAGMPVTIGSTYGLTTSPLPNQATISTIDSDTQVTLSGVCTASGTAVPLVFGINVWIDPAGYGGQGPGSNNAGPYASTTQLRNGIDYMVVIDQGGNPATGLYTSKSGLLRRLSAGPSGAVFTWPGWDFGYGFGYGRAPLTAQRLPAWYGPYASIRTNYTAGWGQGAPAGGTLPVTGAVPTDLTTACNCVAAFIRATTPAGVPLDSDAVGRQVLTLLAEPDAGGSPQLGTARGTLIKYREESL